MAYHSPHNLYPGVNAHLNSFLQQEDGGWEMFHARYLNTLTTIVSQHLPSNYYVTLEKSFQISVSNLARLQRTIPDVGIYQMRPSISAPTAPVAPPQPTLTFSLSATVSDPDDTLLTPVIYELVQGKYPGVPVTRLELLSPGNKLPSAYHYVYLEKRLETLRSGLSLIEIDYLHEAHPVLTILASYRSGDRDSFPYMALVSTPQPSFRDGHLAFYGFGVDAPQPVIPLPLARDEKLMLDLGQVYNETFMSMSVFSLLVDYETEPAAMERYAPADQEKIRQRIAQILAARQEPPD
ncbi:MAG: DUF4058 family protein [bacterium]|nr:DUF4058 family protein [bacterium]